MKTCALPQRSYTVTNMRFSRTLSFIAIASLTGPASAQVRFNRDIRPILSDKCIACHGPDAKHREAGLRLDLAESALAPLTESQGFAIVAGKPAESKMLKHIDSKDPDEVMPPPKSHKTIKPEERALLEQWIVEGATYEPHWSYTPIKRPEIPVVKGKVNNPIDSFILEPLEKKGISPTQQAKPHDLLRRLSLDLTGLPPSPADVAAFTASPEHYSEKVEALLASPRYGERMAVPWLDVVRYADTVGFHGDQNANVFSYRDYVINSFNKNKPFDQFTREQLAGDLLPNPTDEQRIASAFNRLNLMTREGGAQPKEYLAKSAADRVKAVGIAFLGQTTGCAECHDHKYDPIKAKDFYSLAAFFNDVKQWGVYSDYQYTPNPDLKGFENDYPFPPEFISQSASLLNRIAKLQVSMDQELNKNPVPKETLQAWITNIKPFAAAHPDGWEVLPISAAKANKTTPAAIQTDGSVLLSGPVIKDEEITLELTSPASSFGSVRIEAMPDATNKNQIGRSAGGHFTMTPSMEIVDSTGKITPIKAAYTQADLSRPDDYTNGFPKTVSFGATWMSAPARLEYPLELTQRIQTAVLCLPTPMTLPEGARLIARIKSNDIGRIRIAVSPILNPIPGQPAFTSHFLANLESSSADYHLCNTPEAKLSPSCKVILTEIRSSLAGWSRTLTTIAVPEKEKLVTRILPRGNWQDESGEIVKPAILSFLPTDSVPKNRDLTRLDLANWITAKENPLTARHYVNRLWKQFFGKGISNVLDDLGGQGEAPSHQELLDWLASEFRDSGWDTTHMVRLIVTSRTYQQAAATRKDLDEIDPLNRLLAQQTGRRLDAEFIRDNALTIAGLLDTDYVGGLPAKPYQPPGYYTAIQFPDRDYITDPGHGRYRRGLYTHWQRTFLHPELANFDAPSREECAADRLQANTPQQALTLLNDPVFVEAYESLAKRVETATPSDSIKQAFILALTREPSASELEGLTKFYQKQLALFQSGENKSTKFTPELAALAQSCRVILNLHETITRY